MSDGHRHFKKEALRHPEPVDHGGSDRCSGHQLSEGTWARVVSYFFLGCDQCLDSHLLCIFFIIMIIIVLFCVGSIKTVCRRESNRRGTWLWEDRTQLMLLHDVYPSLTTWSDLTSYYNSSSMRFTNDVQLASLPPFFIIDIVIIVSW